MQRSELAAPSLSSPAPVVASVTEKAKDKRFKTHGNTGNMDLRLNPPVPQASPSAPHPETQKRVHEYTTAMKRGLDRLRKEAPGVSATLSPTTGAVEVLRADRALSAASPGTSGEAIVRTFLAANADIYGLTSADLGNLHFIGESASSGSGLRMVRMEQMVNGLPVFQSETRFIIDSDGRVVRSLGQMVPDATATAPAPDFPVSAPQALASALDSIGVTVDAHKMTQKDAVAGAWQTQVVANDPQVAAAVPSRQVYFPAAPGVLVPAWAQATLTKGEADPYTIVSAQTKQVLWRKDMRANLSSEDARFSVYVQADGVTPADSPSPLSPTTVTQNTGTQPSEISRTIVSMSTVQNTLYSPNGWLPDGSSTLIGNNVNAYMDRVGGSNANVPDTAASSVLDGNGRPTGNPDANSHNRDFLGTAPRNFTLTPPPQSGNPEAGQTATGSGSSGTATIDAFRRGVVTQLFYTANWYHDRLAALGFNEAAGNFQTTNFSNQGTGGDAVLAEVEDASLTNTSDFATGPDGTVARLQTYRFTGPTIDRDGALDDESVIHELTHGVSNRLIGNSTGLTWEIGEALGEGWSDFYALALLNNTNADDPNGRYAMQAYTSYKFASGYTDNYLYGLRRFPYTTDNTVNPLTWADADESTLNMSGGITVSGLNLNAKGALDPHNAGEIWCLSLWEVRSRVIADPAGANGDVPTGNQTMLQLVTDAMKMTPANPSFIDARDALLAADAATKASANEMSIWQGFADRGLGYGALCPQTRTFGYTAGHIGLKESFDIPYLDVASVAIDDSQGNNNGALDLNEPADLTVTLKNPWRSAGKGVNSATAILTCSTAGVTVVNDTATYGALPALGSAAGTPFRIKLPLTVTAGQSLDFTLTVTSSLGIKAVTFRERVGTAGGAGTPVTYSSTPSPSLAIPDGVVAGVTDTITVPDDLDIMDVDFRVDSVTHSFVGDLSFMLKGPTGYGTELLSLIGGLTDGGGGHDIINFTIDGQSSGEGILQLPKTSPYTGTFKPLFNESDWTSAGYPGPDPVDQLSYFNNTSSQGNWTLLVADQFAQDAGTLDGWSIIITPRSYTAVTFYSSNAALSALELSMGAYTPSFDSGTLAYTVTLPYGTTSLAVTPTAADTGATIQVRSNGGTYVTVVSGSISAPLTLNPSGNTIDVKVLAEDGTTTKTYTVTIVFATAAPTLGLASSQGLRLQTGLFEETVGVTNTMGAALNGFRLRVTNLPASLRLYNATSPIGSADVYADYSFPLAVGDKVTMTLYFYSAKRLWPTGYVPTFSVEPLSVPTEVKTSNDGLAVTRFLVQPDGSILLEFPAIAGHWYRVKYSNDMMLWFNSQVPVQAGGSRVQWYDRGPPFTSSHPRTVPNRYYKVVEIDNDSK